MAIAPPAESPDTVTELGSILYRPEKCKKILKNSEKKSLRIYVVVAKLQSHIVQGILKTMKAKNVSPFLIR